MRENDRQDDAHAEHGDTHEQAFTGFLRPDIGEFCLSDVHRKLPVLFTNFFDLRSDLTPVIAEIRISG